MYQKVTIVGDGILNQQGLDGILALNTVAANRDIGVLSWSAFSDPVRASPELQARSRGLVAGTRANSGAYARPRLPRLPPRARQRLQGATPRVGSRLKEP